MKDKVKRTAILVVSDSRRVGARGDFDEITEMAGGLQAEGWTVVLRECRGVLGRLAPLGRLTPETDLVVAFLGADRRQAQAVLRCGALSARRVRVPLIVVEPVGGILAKLRKTSATRLLTDRVVSRCLTAPAHVVYEPGLALLADLGLRQHSPPTDGLAPLSFDDLDIVVSVHQRAFPESAMTLLGPRVVERYYRWQFLGDHPHPFAVGSWQDGELVGFVVGGVRHDAVTGFARRFLFDIAIGVLTHPVGARRLLGPKVLPVARLMVRRGRPEEAPVAEAPMPPPTLHTPVLGGDNSFGILSIAVLPKARGSGVAADLMASADAATAAVGLLQMDLTVSPENLRAVRFYERLGWVRVVDGPSWTGRMIKNI